MTSVIVHMQPFMPLLTLRVFGGCRVIHLWRHMKSNMSLYDELLGESYPIHQTVKSDVPGSLWCSQAVENLKQNRSNIQQLFLWKAGKFWGRAVLKYRGILHGLSVRNTLLYQSSMKWLSFPRSLSYRWQYPFPCCFVRTPIPCSKCVSYMKSVVNELVIRISYLFPVETSLEQCRAIFNFPCSEIQHTGNRVNAHNWLDSFSTWCIPISVENAPGDVTMEILLGYIHIWGLN